MRSKFYSYSIGKNKYSIEIKKLKEYYLEYIELSDSEHKGLVSSLTSWVSGLFATAPLQPERGLYLWGGVGRGKTMMMDLFCTCLPEDRTLRMHFHRFMRRVHDSLGR